MAAERAPGEKRAANATGAFLAADAGSWLLLGGHLKGCRAFIRLRGSRCERNNFVSISCGFAESNKLAAAAETIIRSAQLYTSLELAGRAARGPRECGGSALGGEQPPLPAARHLAPREWNASAFIWLRSRLSRRPHLMATLDCYRPIESFFFAG